MNKEKIDHILNKVNFNKLGGLVPVITQDASTRKVLMLAFMNREALKLTLETGKVHYWSRTRNKLWLKGESSGNIQLLQDVFFDCDYDSLLILIDQVGVCCHTGAKTCFHNPIK